MDAVGDADDARGVLLDEEDGAAGRLEAGDDRVDLLDDERGETQRGLVDEEHAPAHHQPAPDAGHPAFAARQGRGDLPPPLGELREASVDLVEPGRHDGAAALRVGAHAQVLLDAHLREQHVALRHVGHAPCRDGIGRQARQRAPAQRD